MAMVALCPCCGGWTSAQPGVNHRAPYVYADPPVIRHCQTCTCDEAALKQTVRLAPFQDQRYADR